ncbi:hypothetical protein Btru_055385 [Bulinus truncatus]|nr:hypothetical protein Btru_055385 [Bulinus truncatus]
MSNLSETKSVIERATSAMGGLDLLVLNHITSQSIAPFLGTPENITAFDKVIDVNLRSYVYLTSYALPQLVVNRGGLVVISSLLGRVPHPYIGSYSASKHALHGFFESLRMQFLALKQDVSVTMCTLGFIGTQNAIQQMQKSDHVEMPPITPASPSDTALAIVQASARRQDQLYYPFWSIASVNLLRNLYPPFMDKFVVKIVT